MAVAARKTKRKKAAVIRGRAPEKITRTATKRRGLGPLAAKPEAKQAPRKPGRPAKSSTGAQAAAGRLDSALSAQLEAISVELASLAGLRDAIRDLQSRIEALADRIDSLAEFVRADGREHQGRSETLPGSDDHAKTETLASEEAWESDKA